MKRFLLENGSRHPYNDILITRNRMHVQWLMLFTSPRPPNGLIDRHPIVVPTTTFDADTVQHLLLTKQALPVPNVVSKVIDCMEDWGKEYDLEWYNEVVNLIAYLLSNQTVLTQEELFYDLLEFKINALIYEYIGLNEHVTATRIFDLWKDKFHYDFCYNGVRDFKQAAVASFATVMIQVNAYLQVQTLLQNTPVAATAPVPVSPVSIPSRVTE